MPRSKEQLKEELGKVKALYKKKFGVELSSDILHNFCAAFLYEKEGAFLRNTIIGHFPADDLYAFCELVHHESEIRASTSKTSGRR